MTTNHSSQDFSIRPGKRTVRACDECRRLKIRCELPDTDLPNVDGSKRCRGCSVSGIDCAFTAPVHKRGPPKGYLSALEQRLNDAEALLGALICSKDSRAASLIADLSQDPLASSIINRVAKSEFGPTGRAERMQSSSSRQFKQTESPIFSIDHNGHLVFTSPSNTWQDYLDMRLNLESRSRTNRGLPDQMQSMTLSSPDTAYLQQSPFLGSPEMAEAQLNNLHARLCEEINSWLHSDQINHYRATDFMNSSTDHHTPSFRSDYLASPTSEATSHNAHIFK